MLEGNHFSSDKNLTATYQVDKVDKDLSLILVLRPKDEKTK